jgi:hypothetical protein
VRPWKRGAAELKTQRATSVAFWMLRCCQSSVSLSITFRNFMRMNRKWQTLIETTSGWKWRQHRVNLLSEVKIKCSAIVKLARFSTKMSTSTTKCYISEVREIKQLKLWISPTAWGFDSVEIWKWGVNIGGKIFRVCEKDFLPLAWNAYADEVKLAKLDTRLSIFGLRDFVEWSVMFSNHNSGKLMKLGGERSQSRLGCFVGCLRGWDLNLIVVWKVE